MREACEAASARIEQALAALPPETPAAQALRRAREDIERVARGHETVAARYRSLLDAVPDAVTVHDAQGRILDANRTACESFGFPLQRLRELSVHDLNPTLPPGHMDELWRTFQLGQAVTVETTNIRADGRRFPVEVHSNAFEDGSGRRVVAVARDITLRKQAESALRSSEERYRLLLDAVDKGILVQDRDGHVLSANAAAARSFGFSEAELRSGSFSVADWSLVDEAGQPLKWGDVPAQRAMRTGRVVDSTLVGVYSPRVQGVSWFSVTAVPQFLDGESEPFQVISLFSDVTALKRQSELFRQTQALASIGGWERDFNRGTLFCTEEVLRLLDLPAGASPSWHVLLTHFVEPDRERLTESLRQAQSEGAAFDLELRLVTRTHHRRWVRMIGRAVLHRGQAQGVSGTMQDITLRKVQEEQLRRQALTDTLTGLANRDALLRTLTRAIDESAPGHGPSLLYIDLDRFKVINDLLGHAAGDGLLVAASQRLKDVVGGDATLARFGGDEFMLVVPWSPDKDLPVRIAERVTAAFARPFDYAGEEFTITASVGVAEYPGDGATIQQLINHADAAMFEAKRRGRNKWQHFSPQLARTLTDRLLVETQLRRALDNNEFYLHFQPQVDLATGRPTGAEALLRWRSRMLGELAPGVFIGHAENTGDIVRIGAWVIRQACRQMRAWLDAGIDIPRVAVNVSYRQFLSESLPDIVASSLAEYGLPGAALELEMTERVLVEDVPDTLETFNALKRLGVQLVIDDFGEGYSALNYLRQLPFDGLKISHTFMQGIPNNSADSAICQAVIRIAQSLGLAVIAEGVETEAQRQFLLRHGCTLAQGFLFAKPVAPTELAEYAARFSPARDALA
ncbi:MAG TPA: EAL domain-containing protein [Xanthomonadales bacterium]|nr:EAL domain-containing protein [Xanthomonadales bacterium]